MNIIEYFPLRIRDKLQKEIGQVVDELEEIRIRVNCPIILKLNQREKIIYEKITNLDTKEILQYICENSIYAYQNEINQGYITVMGGHRVGIAGNCVIENNKVINISYIYSINFRMARQKLGSANEVIKNIIDYENKTIYSTLIVSPPGAGKTTILRDLIRQLSNGIDNIMPRKNSRSSR